MKTALLKLLLFLLLLLSCTTILFLSAPFILDAYVIPKLLEQLPALDKSASISRLTPFSASGTLRLEDSDRPVASIPRFELRYTPTLLLKRHISSLMLEQATVHLEKKGKTIRFSGFYPSKDHGKTGHSERPPLLLPLRVDSLILKQCSLVLHEAGKSSLRASLSTRIDLSYDTTSSAGFELSAIEGIFSLSDSIVAQGQFSIAPGSQERALSLAFQAGPLPGLDHPLFSPLKSSTVRGMSAKLSAVIDTKQMTIKDIKASGELQQFQPSFADISLYGQGEENTVSFTISGSPQKLDYSFGPVVTKIPLSTQTTATGTAAITDKQIQTEGILNTVFNSNDVKHSLSSSFSGSFDQETKRWKGALISTHKPEVKQTISLDRLAVAFQNVVMKASASGGGESFEGSIQVDTDPFSIKNDTFTGQFTGLSAAAHLTGSSEDLAIRITGLIPEISVPEQELLMDSVTFDLPFSYPRTASISHNPGFFAIQSVSISNTAVLSAKATTSYVQERFTFAGSINALFDKNLAVSFNGTADPFNGNSSATWSLPKTAIDVENLPSLFKIPEGLSLIGSIESHGQASYNNSRLSGNVQTSFSEGSLSIAEKQLSIEGINCSLEFPRLPDYVSSPSQLCSIADVTLSTMRFSDARIRFRIEDLETLFIEKSSVRWCQGSVESTSLRLSRKDTSIDTALYCSRVNFAELLNQLGLQQADGKGSLNGKLPIQISKEGISFDDGFLFSTPGTGGIIKFSNTDMLRQGVGGVGVAGYLDYSMKAMEDFAYSWTKLSFNSSGNELLLTMELDGKPRSPLPYGFKNGMIIETTKGEGLQYPIRLDVNFRLPLAELFQIGQNIQSLRENM